MRDNFIQMVLQNFFSPSDKKDWEKVAMQETNGKNPFESLTWSGKDGEIFLPYYDAQDLDHLQFLNNFHIPAANAQHARTWLNIPALRVSQETTANALALDHLSSGADGVLFDVRSKPETDCSRLLHDIQWPHCTLYFNVQDEKFVNGLVAYIDNTLSPDVVNGALFWESVPAISSVRLCLRWRKFACLGLMIGETSPSQEICDALLRGVQVIEAFQDVAAMEDIFAHVTFAMPVNASLVETVAKLKALRMLWYQIAHAYGNDDYKLTDLKINAYSSRVTDRAYGPHENMLKSTFSAIAAIAGGCDSLSIESDVEPAFATRQARNVSVILQEESFFHRSADPFAGSYAVESVTDAFAQKAWSMFQNKWRQL